MSEIGPKVYDLAEKIAGEAIDAEDAVFRLDCFKALSQFYIGVTRISGKKDGEEELGGSSILDMRAKIAEAAQVDKPLVASARRRANGEARDRDRKGRYE